MNEHQDRLSRVRTLVADEPDRIDIGNVRVGVPGAADDIGRLCRAALRALQATGVGLSVTSGSNGYGTVAASDALSALVDELQFTVGEGPCTEAVSSGRPVLTADLDTASARWPAYAPLAYAHGVRAVFAFPLRIGGLCLGAMDVYRTRAGPMSHAAQKDAAAFAEIAAQELMDCQAGMPDGQAADVLTQGLNRRSEVYQAQGMVSIQLSIGLAEAMIRLRAHAYSHDQPLHRLAQDILARRLELTANYDDA